MGHSRKPCFTASNIIAFHGNDNEPRKETVAIVELQNEKLENYEPPKVTLLSETAN